MAHTQADWQVLVDCPTLSTEQRAELEARHLVELRTLPGPSATLRIRCTETAVEGSWERAGSVLTKRSVTRAPDDDLVELGHGIAAILIGLRESESGTADSERSQSEAPLPAAEITPVEGFEEEPDEQGPETAKSPPSSHPPEDAQHSKANPQNEDASSRDAPQTGSALSWWTGLGVSAHYVGRQAPFTLGPSLEGGVQLVKKLSLRGSVAAEWGLSRADAFGIFEIAPGAQAQLTLTPWLQVATGVVLSLLTVQGNTPATARRSLLTTAGGDLLLRVSTPRPGWGAFASLSARLLARSRHVASNGEVVMIVAPWQLGMNVGLQFGAAQAK